VTLPTVSVLNTQGVLDSSYKPSIPNETLLQAYKVMVLTRHIDERMITLQRQGMISFALSSLGEEACAVASAAALQIGDWMYPQYREAGIMFWRGFTPAQFVHNMFGNREDLILGRQMPNHFGARDLNVVTVSSPIGTKIPHAAGCAYAMKLQKEPRVVICYFGEGAASQGDFHAGLNFAAVRGAPVIFFCRNNGYAISTPCSKQYVGAGIAERGFGYGITTHRIDGNDFFTVYDTVVEARKHCLAGKGPVLIEAMTYRLGAHSSSDDPSIYRSEGEVEKWKEKCPILRLKRYLEKQGIWDETQENTLLKETHEVVTEAIRIAKETPRPPLDYIVEHVYSEVPSFLKEELDQLKNEVSND
jgi:pyruvate dehydrogenase E1 component alpha subunit